MPDFKALEQNLKEQLADRDALNKSLEELISLTQKAQNVGSKEGKDAAELLKRRQDLLEKFNKEQQVSIQHLTRMAWAGERVTSVFGGFLNSIRDAAKAQVEYNLSQQRTAQIMGMVGKTMQEQAGALQDLQNQLKLTRTEAKEFFSTWEQGASLGIDPKQLTDITKQLQMLRGHTQGMLMGKQIPQMLQGAGLMGYHLQGLQNTKDTAQYMRMTLGMTPEQRAIASDVRNVKGMVGPAGVEQKKSDTVASIDKMKDHLGRIIDNFSSGILTSPVFTALPLAVLGISQGFNYLKNTFYAKAAINLATISDQTTLTASHTGAMSGGLGGGGGVHPKNPWAINTGTGGAAGPGGGQAAGIPKALSASGVAQQTRLVNGKFVPIGLREGLAPLSAAPEAHGALLVTGSHGGLPPEQAAAAKQVSRAKYGGGMAVAGMGASMLGGKMQESESAGMKTGGKALSAGGSIASMAGMGMMVGGPWGAAAGAAVGVAMNLKELGEVWDEVVNSQDHINEKAKEALEKLREENTIQKKRDKALEETEHLAAQVNVRLQKLADFGVAQRAGKVAEMQMTLETRGGSASGIVGLVKTQREAVKAKWSDFEEAYGATSEAMKAALEKINSLDKAISDLGKQELSILEEKRAQKDKELYEVNSLVALAEQINAANEAYLAPLKAQRATMQAQLDYLGVIGGDYEALAAAQKKSLEVGAKELEKNAEAAQKNEEDYAAKQKEREEADKAAVKAQGEVAALKPEDVQASKDIEKWEAHTSSDLEESDKRRRARYGAYGEYKLKKMDIENIHKEEKKTMSQEGTGNFANVEASKKRKEDALSALKKEKGYDPAFETDLWFSEGVRKIEEEKYEQEKEKIKREYGDKKIPYEGIKEKLAAVEKTKGDLDTPKQQATREREHLTKQAEYKTKDIEIKKKMFLDENRAKMAMSAEGYKQTGEYAAGAGMKTAYGARAETAISLGKSSAEVGALMAQVVKGQRMIAAEAQRQLPIRLQEIKDLSKAAKEAYDDRIKLAKTPEEQNKLKEDKKKVFEALDMSEQEQSARAVADAEKEIRDVRKEAFEATQKVADVERGVLDVVKTKLDVEMSVAEKLGASYGTLLSIQKDQLTNKRKEYQITLQQYEAYKAQWTGTEEEFSRNKEAQEMEKKMLQDKGDIIQRSFGLQRDFLDRALGRMFGAMNQGTKAQPLMHKRMALGEYTEFGGLARKGEPTTIAGWQAGMQGAPGAMGGRNIGEARWGPGGGFGMQGAAGEPGVPFAKAVAQGTKDALREGKKEFVVRVEMAPGAEKWVKVTVEEEVAGQMRGGKVNQ